MEVAFNEGSYKKWLARNFDANGNPKVANPDVSLIGTIQTLTCVECGYRDEVNKDYAEKNPWMKNQYKCRKCRHQ